MGLDMPHPYTLAEEEAEIFQAIGHLIRHHTTRHGQREEIKIGRTVVFRAISLCLNTIIKTISSAPHGMAQCEEIYSQLSKMLSPSRTTASSRRKELQKVLSFNTLCTITLT